MSKLFLLFLLAIWRPAQTAKSPMTANTVSPPAEDPVSSLISTALGVFDDDKLDREWVVRNVLGGMSAGFGLRGAFFLKFISDPSPSWLQLVDARVCELVIFDWHPGFTTIIIFVSWGIKTLVSRVVSGWVGGSEQAGEVWLAYSIP